MAPATAYRRVQHALDAVNARNIEDAGTLRDIEAMRLDELQAAIWQKAVEGEGAAIDRVLHVMARRAKLLGLDEPERRESKVKFDPQEAAFRRRLLVAQILTEVRNQEADEPSS